VNLTQSLKQLDEQLLVEEKENLPHGLTLRLQELTRLFHLNEFEVDTLLICLLPELNLKYQRMYAYLQDDATQKSPTVDLVLHVLCDSSQDRLAKRKAFLAEAPLIKHNLVYLNDGHPLKVTPLLAKSIQIDMRIAGYLLEEDQIDARLLSFTHLIHPGLTLNDVILPEYTKQRLLELTNRFNTGALICSLQGPYGVGKKTVAEAICHDLQIPIIYVDMILMLSQEAPLGQLISLVFRECKLHDAALYLNHFDELLADEKTNKPFYSDVLNQMEDFPNWLFLAGEKAWEPKGRLNDKRCIFIEFPVPSYQERRQLWEKSCNDRLMLPDNVDLDDISKKFRLSGGQIQDAVAAVRNTALWRTPDSEAVTAEYIYAACRNQSRQRLNVLARKINPGYSWDDIILPSDQMGQLREICDYVQHYHTVYDSWGFYRKLSLGKGLNVLFAGPSGTGKTMAAEIMANELGLDLYKIDLSTIVSKYIGETEKNLDRIFREGQSLNAILLFDEADALFGKRSEVRDSHDRYANIEVAYLLQKMEEYEGIVVLATNLRKNMDEAFARRMHFALEFPVPDETDRYRIWESIFPKEAPVTKETDLHFLAQQFKITGGNIKNIALGAAFLAAADDCLITMDNLIKATKREYQKMGKLCTESDFANYFNMVKT
jgi:SpoVK/Ycf46/Vps4 family AAA+-type ATPase